MKLTKQIFAFAAAAMLLTGCGGGNGGGQGGDKTDKNKFLQAAANLPAEHPYTTATVVNTSQRPGKQDTKVTTTFTWNGYDWVREEGYQGYPGYSIPNYVSMIDTAVESGEMELVSDEYYINPFSLKLVCKTDYGTGIKYEVTNIMKWNDYGLTTYIESSVKYDAGLMVEKFEITYGGESGQTSESASQQEQSASTSQPTGEVTLQELYDSFDFNHPYTSASLKVTATATASGQTQSQTTYGSYSYSDENGWICNDDQEAYPAYTSLFADTILPALISGATGYEAHAFIGASSSKLVLMVSGVSITTTYNQYGLPTKINQVQEGSGYSVTALVEVTYN